MTTPVHPVQRKVECIFRGESPEALREALRPRPPSEVPLPKRVHASTDHSREAFEKRRARLADQGIRTEQLAAEGMGIEPQDLAGRIEGFTGFARIPVGVFGPLRINGSAAHGDFYVPLATTEGTLVASFQHVANVINRAGGAAVLCTKEMVGRAPCFVFATLADSGVFLHWLLPQIPSLQEIVARTSRFCELVDVKTTVVANEVFLLLEYTTGDAAGQNMVTIATEAICRHLLEQMPVQPRHWQLESNLSGDKKPTIISFLNARGKRVSAEVEIPNKLIRRYFRVDAAKLVRIWEVSLSGTAQSGTVGAQGNFANPLTGLFIACGQDVACVSEAVVGLTRVELLAGGDLYISVSLPNLIVGTVGGASYLPTARECLEMLGCYGEGHSRKFAEICAVTTLAGELAVIGAMAGGTFAQAHATLGRRPGGPAP
ncbi:MAG: hydroxymethylglutaryl-CoA reductase [bacterium]|nr:hydroxymethylglutaryl-CoA reductase [bacterium]